MDPLSVAASVLGLAATCVSLSKGLNDLRSKYSRADITISAIAAECQLMSTSLNQIAIIARRDSQAFASRLSAGDGCGGVPLDLALESALGSCNIILGDLGDVVGRCSRTNPLGLLSWRSKATYMWKEDDMKETLQTIRNVQAAMNTLLTAMQAESVSDVRQILNANTAVLQTMVQRSQNAKGTYAGSTISGMDIKFNFDDEIVSSSVYRRAFRSFVKRSKVDTVAEEQKPEDTSVYSKPPIVRVETAASSPTRGFAIEDHLEDNSLTLVSELPPRPKSAQQNKAPIATTAKRTASGITAPPATADLELGNLLRISAESGNAALVKAFLDKGADIESAAPSDGDKHAGARALHLATLKGHSEVVKLLLDSGADRLATCDAGNAAIHLAASAGDLDSAKILLEDEIDSQIESVGQDDYTPLHFAAKSGYVPIVRFLLENGADVAARASLEATPLHVAAEYMQSKTAEVLIEEGNSDVEAQTRYHNRPLNLACCSGHVPTIKALLNAGADIEAQGTIGWRPLHHASGNKQVSAVRTLLGQGADIEGKAENGDTPLHVATKFDCRAVVDLLLEKGANIEAVNSFEDSPLHIAASQGKVGIIEQLLKHGAELEAVGSEARTPLLIAVEEGNVAAVNALIVKGADKDARNTSSNLAINLASLAGHTAVLETLLRHGADINARGCIGWRPLHHSAGNGHTKAAKLLLERGADKTATSDDGRTPLHVATLPEITECLIDSGADIEVEDQGGLRPIHFAARKQDSKTLSLLLRKGASIEAGRLEHPIHSAAGHGCAKNIQILLEAGADKDAITFSKNHPINLAAASGLWANVKTLLDAGADVNSVGCIGWQPLHHAAGNGRHLLVDLLLDAGAAIEGEAENGDRPLHVAAKHGSIECTKRLLAAGAKVDARQSEGLQPLHYAANAGSLKIINLLLENGADQGAIDDQGRTPRDIALEQKHSRVAELFTV